jgi:hypothetical protein
MALPKIDLPIFETKLLSTDEKIKFRPYTVKEEKILLVAQEARDPLQEILAMKQVINNCLIDKDVSDLAMFDLEYMHIMLRSKSVDNNVVFSVKDPDTEESVQLELDLDKVKLVKKEDHTNEIKLNDDYMLYLRYPTIDAFVKIAEMSAADPLVSYFIMVNCLDKIASEDEIFHFKDYTAEDIDAFMEGLSGDVISKIQRFFETMPKIRHEMKYTNKNGNEKTFVVEGLRSFFQ